MDELRVREKVEHLRFLKDEKKNRTSHESRFSAGTNGFRNHVNRKLRKVKVLKNPPSSESICSETKNGKKVLMQHQQIISELTKDKHLCKRLLIVSPTGSGKTIMMATVLDNYFEDSRAKVVIFPNEELSTNFYSEFQKIANKYIIHDEPLNMEKLRNDLAMLGDLRKRKHRLNAPLRSFSYSEAQSGGK